MSDPPTPELLRPPTLRARIIRFQVACFVAYLGVEAFRDHRTKAPLIEVPYAVAVAALTMAILWLTSRYIDRRPLAAYGFRLNGTWIRQFVAGFALGMLVASWWPLCYLLQGRDRVTDVLYVRPGGPHFVVAVLVGSIYWLLLALPEEIMGRASHFRAAA